MTCLQKLECKLHRLECHALAKLDKERRKSVTPTIRMMVKLYLRRKLQNENVMGLFFYLFFYCFICESYGVPCFVGNYLKFAYDFLQVIPVTAMDNYSLVEALVSRIFFF